MNENLFITDGLLEMFSDEFYSLFLEEIEYSSNGNWLWAIGA